MPNVDSPYIIWVAIVLLAATLINLIYRLVKAGLLSAGLDDRQSRIVASVLLGSTGVYALIKLLPYVKG
ncbi:MAG: hypothetical protein A4E53_00550 [Pelotomaculum sp. PtaB.Bin104]|nr:MAG: hypothetical protein A4E53_00550 [Pelotomaculum sp. PtaB.Bin104]